MVLVCSSHWRTTFETLTCLIKRTPNDAQFKNDKRVRVKLSGDSTYIGQHLHVVNFTFIILDEGRKAFSVEGKNYGLAIIQAEELRGNEDSTC